MPTKSNTRLLLKMYAGYSRYHILLPESMNAEHARDFAKGIMVEAVGDEFIAARCEEKPKIIIVDSDDIVKVYDHTAEDHPQKIIINLIREKLEECKDHHSVIFNRDNVEICDGRHGSKRVEYKEMSDPGFDPEVFADDIIKMATSGPALWSR